MSRLLLAAALLAGCHRVKPETDCDFVRQVLSADDGFDPSASSASSGSAAVVAYDVTVVEALSNHTFREPAIAAAAKLVARSEPPTATSTKLDYLDGVQKLHALCPYR